MVGIIYNTSMVEEADTGSWDLLWNERYSGKILQFNNPRDAFGTAMYWKDMDINSADQENCSNNQVWDWMKRNCQDYGFIWRYLYSAEIIRQAKISFEGAYLEDELFLMEYFCNAKKLCIRFTFNICLNIIYCGSKHFLCFNAYHSILKNEGKGACNKICNNNTQKEPTLKSISNSFTTFVSVKSLVI